MRTRASAPLTWSHATLEHPRESKVSLTEALAAAPGCLTRFSHRLSLDCETHSPAKVTPLTFPFASTLHKVIATPSRIVYARELLLHTSLFQLLSIHIFNLRLFHTLLLFSELHPYVSLLPNKKKSFHANIYILLLNSVFLSMSVTNCALCVFTRDSM